MKILTPASSFKLKLPLYRAVVLIFLIYSYSLHSEVIYLPKIKLTKKNNHPTNLDNHTERQTEAISENQKENLNLNFPPIKNKIEFQALDPKKNLKKSPEISTGNGSEIKLPIKTKEGIELKTSTGIQLTNLESSELLRNSFPGKENEAEKNQISLTTGSIKKISGKQLILESPQLQIKILGFLESENKPKYSWIENFQKNETKNEIQTIFNIKKLKDKNKKSLLGFEFDWNRKWKGSVSHLINQDLFYNIINTQVNNKEVASIQKSIQLILSEKSEMIQSQFHHQAEEIDHPLLSKNFDFLFHNQNITSQILNASPIIRRSQKIQKLAFILSPKSEFIQFQTQFDFINHQEFSPPQSNSNYQRLSEIINFNFPQMSIKPYIQQKNSLFSELNVSYPFQIGLLKDSFSSQLENKKSQKHDVYFRFSPSLNLSNYFFNLDFFQIPPSVQNLFSDGNLKENLNLKHETGIRWEVGSRYNFQNQYLNEIFIKYFHEETKNSPIIIPIGPTFSKTYPLGGIWGSGFEGQLKFFLDPNQKKQFLTFNYQQQKALYKSSLDWQVGKPVPFRPKQTYEIAYQFLGELISHKLSYSLELDQAFNLSNEDQVKKYQSLNYFFNLKIKHKSHFSELQIQLKNLLSKNNFQYSPRQENFYSPKYESFKGILQWTYFSN